MGNQCDSEVQVLDYALKFVRIISTAKEKQNDLLFDELTPKEHIYLLCAIKGVSVRLWGYQARDALSGVNLEKVLRRPVSCNGLPVERAFPGEHV